MRVKKNVLLLALALAVSGVAFGLPEFKVSFGGGGIFSTVLGNGWKYSENGVNLKETNTMVEGGGFAFFDATFVEADFAFLGGGITNKYSSNGRSDTSSGSLSALDLAFLGKYPVSLGPVTVFPLLGFDYLIVTSVKFEGKKVDKPGESSSFAFDFGGGLDFSLGSHLYLRGEFLYAIRLPTKVQKDQKKDFKDDYGVDAKYVLGNGPTIKLAVGYAL